jgi:hypothetical protein
LEGHLLFKQRLVGMYRACVRHTFLSFEEDSTCSSAVKQRSRSADFARASRLIDEVKQNHDEVALGHLNTMLKGRLASEGLEKKPALKSVLSNSSVSTMAPEDWDCDGQTPHGNSDEDVTWFAESEYDLQQQEEQHQQHQMQQELQLQQLQQASRQHPSDTVFLKEFQHCRVPKNLNLAEEFCRSLVGSPPTTMMIRNIPNRYTQRELICELESLGFTGTFDFLYAPIDFGTMGNVGYAFVNFMDPIPAERCREVVDGYTFKKHQQKTRTKVAKVSVAHLQGLQANIRHYEKSAVTGRARSKRCGPVIMTNIANALAFA